MTTIWVCTPRVRRCSLGCPLPWGLAPAPCSSPMGHMAGDGLRALPTLATHSKGPCQVQGTSSPSLLGCPSSPHPATTSQQTQTQLHLRPQTLATATGRDTGTGWGLTHRTQGARVDPVDLAPSVPAHTAPWAPLKCLLGYPWPWGPLVNASFSSSKCLSSPKGT